MIRFNKPENLNGSELIDELLDAGVLISENLERYKGKEPPLDDGNGGIWLSISADQETIAENIVNAHNGTVIAPELTAAKKLEAAGLTVNELKELLGL